MVSSHQVLKGGRFLSGCGLGIFCASKCSIGEPGGEVCVGAASPHQGSQRFVMMGGGVLDPGLLRLRRRYSGQVCFPLQSPTALI